MTRFFRAYLILFLLFLDTAWAVDLPAVFEPGEVGRSKLEIESGVPLATFTGSPREIGCAQGVLLGKAGQSLFRFFLEPAAIPSGGVKRLSAEAMELEPYIPRRYRDEMKAMAQACDMTYEQIVTGNAFPDVYRGGGCSTLAASAPATKNGEPLLARNLDFFSMGVLDKNGIIALYRPEGFNAFASVTWSGITGVLSGMNEKGLCCAVMEVRTGLRRNDGMPSVFLFRRVMEEAGTVEEGLKVLKGAVRVASNNLILLDENGAAAVAEIGPDRFEVRRPEEGVLYSTNDHRAGMLFPPPCGRYQALRAFCLKHRGELDADLMKKVLHQVRQGTITVQSMLFEPIPLKLHLAMGKLPATEGVYRVFDLKERLSPPRKEEPTSNMKPGS